MVILFGLSEARQVSPVGHFEGDSEGSSSELAAWSEATFCVRFSCGGKKGFLYGGSWDRLCGS